MSNSSLLKRWLCLLLAMALVTVVFPAVGSRAWAEDEQEEIAADPEPPPPSEGVEGAYHRHVPGDTEEQAALGTDVVSPLVTRVSVTTQPVGKDWQAWQFKDFIVVARKADVSGQTATLKLLPVIAASQVTRPGKAGESLAPHVLVIQSLQPQASATWSVGWPAELK